MAAWRTGSCTWSDRRLSAARPNVRLWRHARAADAVRLVPDAASRWRMRHALQSSGDSSESSLEYGAHYRPEAATKAASHPGYQDTAAARTPYARFGNVQSRDRQEAARLRSCPASRGYVVLGGTVRLRMSIIQQKTGRPVPFELTAPTREALTARLRRRPAATGDWLFPSRGRPGDHVTTRQYGRTLGGWVASIGLDPALYGTHSLRRTQPDIAKNGRFHLMENGSDRVGQCRSRYPPAQNGRFLAGTECLIVALIDATDGRYTASSASACCYRQTRPELQKPRRWARSGSQF